MRAFLQGYIQRDSSNKRSHEPYQTLPHDAFISQACLVCFERSPTLLRCSGCNLGSYQLRTASRSDLHGLDGTTIAHAAQRMPEKVLQVPQTVYHKPFCAAVKEIEKLPDGPFPPLPTRTTVLRNPPQAPYARRARPPARSWPSRSTRSHRASPYLHISNFNSRT